MIRLSLKLLLLVSFFLTTLYGKAQPKVGEPLPAFRLEQVKDYPLPTISNADFKGKWLVLDFWFKGCAACITSMPRTSQLQQYFQDRMVFMLVGLNESKRNQGIEELYDKLKQKQGLKIPHAFDSLLFGKWKIHAMPFIVIVNPEGVVYATTDGRDITIEKMEDMLAGKKVKYFSSSALVTNTASKAEGDVILGSAVRKWAGSTQYLEQIDGYAAFIQQSKFTATPFKISMAPLYMLYNTAYFGHPLWSIMEPIYYKVYPKPILEIKDRSLFDFDFNLNVGKGAYDYTLTLPFSQVTRKQIMNRFQVDLQQAFGYKASVQTRMVPVSKLVVTNEKLAQKMMTKGGKMVEPTDFAGGFSIKNMPASSLIFLVSYYLSPDEGPYFDSTHLKGNIDIELDVDMTNREQIRAALKKYGLDLVKGEAKMQVVVIKEQ